MATSSYARTLVRGWRLIASVAAAYVAAAGGALLAVRALEVDGAAGVVAVFALATIVIVAITALFLIPHLRNLERGVSLAEALASGRFDYRVDVPPGAAAPLLHALNGAAQRVADLLGSLRDERAQLASLLNASSDATLAVDTEGTITYANDAAAALLSSSSPVGAPFIAAARDHDLNDLIMSAARSGERGVRVVTFGPEQRWIQATAVPIHGGGSWAALAIFHDLTEVRRLESLRRDFISNVSHELRTPLAGIRSAAETLDEGALEDGEAAREFLAHILRESDRMTQLVEELLELSRIESGTAPMRFTELDLGTLVEDAARRFRQQAERAGLSVSVQAPAERLTVVGDAERLERALGNLVANAIKFTPAGGTVTIAAQREEGDAVLSVTDTGIGIEPEQRMRVFERFYKADPGRGGGTGLGLAIVKHTVRAHGGSVSVESFPGRGSTFSIRLPRR